jgi:uncharacterized RDD family membrane protein YckC
VNPPPNPAAETPAGIPLLCAGFWIRCFAGLIDLAVLLIPFSVIVTFVTVGMNIWNSFFFGIRPGQPLPEELAIKGPLLVSIGIAVFILLGWFYFAFLESSSWRGTIGKHYLGLYVGDARGNRIGFWQATRRFAGGRLLLHLPFVGIYYFMVDCLCIAVIKPNRAIHDVLSGCLVLQDSVFFVKMSFARPPMVFCGFNFFC